MAISTNGTIITRLAGALYGEYLSNASYLEVNTTAAATVAANWLSNDFAGKTDAELATTILTNLGLTSITGLDNYVAGQLTAAGSTGAAKGAALVSMLNSYAGMTADATYGTYATAFNTKVNAALAASQVTGATGGTFAAIEAAASTGSTITLTTAAETKVGTANNDTFYGLAAASGGTYNSADIINGGAGNDTLSLVGTGTVTDIATVSNVETVAIRATATTSISLAGIAGLTAVRNDNSVANVTVTGLKTASTIGISETTDDTAVTYATSGLGASSTAAVSLEVSNVGVAADSAVVTITAGTNDTVRTLNIAASGANTITIGEDGIGDTVTTLNVSGSGSVTVKSVAEDTDTVGSLEIVTTVNASTNTGGVTVDLATGANAAAVTVTGGAGNDKIIFTDGDLTSADSVSLGDGTTDTVALYKTSGSISYTSTSSAVAINAVAGAERVEFGTLATSAADLTIDVAMSNITANAVVIGGNAALDSGTTATDAVGEDTVDITAFTNSDSILITKSITGGKGGTEAPTTVAVTAGNNGGVALDIDALVDSPLNIISITLSAVTLTGGAGGDGGAATGGATTGGDAGNGAYAVDLNEFDTISIITTGTAASSFVAGAAGTRGATTASGASGATGTAADGAISVAAGAEITVSGTKALTMGTIVAGSGAISLNASTLAGALSVTTTGYGDLITGGLGNDTIDAGSGIDQIDLSIGGKDTVTIGVTAAANRDLISGFTAGNGGDILNLIGTIASTDAATVITGTAASITLADAKEIYEYAFEATANSADLDASLTGSELGKAFSSGTALTTLTASSAETGYIVAYDNGNAYVYYFDAGSGDTTVTLSSEVALVAVITGVAVGAINMDNIA
jgi:hypothetical protein